ncbi:MAG: 30S ribosomal protein S1 [candidate division Zixibacteria bacterium]|nr:30S ribosomal protein S1 [candidate division Zixibacteria bacterium]
MAEQKKSAAKKKAAKKTKKGGKKKAAKKKITSKAATEEKSSEIEEIQIKKTTRKKAPRIRRKAVDEPAPLELTLQDIEEEEYSKDEFERMLADYECTIKDIKEGEVIEGTIAGVTRDDVIVDVGFKSEGLIPIEEFTEPVNIQVGEKISVFLEAVEDQDGQLVLSKTKADFMRVWDEIKDAGDSNQLVRGRLMRRIKGGIVVDLFGVDAFLPGSQIALRQIPDFDELIGKEMDFRIIKLNKNRRNIVVSRRVVLEEQRDQMRDQIISEIQPGQERDGIVKNITDFGVFIDLGGVDGLLHITDMSWGRVTHPSEMVSLGDTIKVKILDFDKDTSRISLGLKQLTPYPWENIEEKYPIGQNANGKVVSITDYGAFVELEKGVEGLIHISEMSWTQHIKHPSKLVQIGDEIEAVVLSVDKANEKISLGIKQLNADPWETLEHKYPPGTHVTGKVRNLTTFGAFVEIEEGIDGLVHISDMSWTKRIQHPSEVMKKGETIDVVVLNIDKENRRVSLGRKQMEGDPWPALAIKYSPGIETSGKISRLLDRGVIIELEDEVEGFVPSNQLAKPDISKPAEAFTVDEELMLKVTEFDQHTRKIILSVDAYYRDREKSEMEEYLAKHPTITTTVGDVVGDLSEVLPDDEASESTPSDEVPADIEDTTESIGETREEAPAEVAAETEEPVVEQPVEETSAEEISTEDIQQEETTESAEKEETEAEETPIESTEDESEPEKKPE